jgi:phosphatidylethanolamine/phosphatidyl-N-methylethanolamine N-methyltransferase
MLSRSYQLIAPVYDLAVARALEGPRRRSLAKLPRDGRQDILIDGIGTGLDLPHLPLGHRYIGTDLVAAMLRPARARARGLDCELLRADSMKLPFAAASFDWVVLHLIVAVVPDPVAALEEAARVVRPGGYLLVLDKFLRRGQIALLRRVLNPFVSRLATRLDVVFEDTLAQVPNLRVISDEPALATGWFRNILLQRTAD